MREVPTTHGDEHKRRLVRVAIPETDGVFQPTVHYDCTHNQVQAIRNRVIGVVVKPSPHGLALVRSAVRDVTATLRQSGEDDIFALADRHGGQKGRRYRDAAVKYGMFGINATDACIKMFVKSERFNPISKINPDPRAIQFRGAKFCVALAQYLRPIEEKLYLFSQASDGVANSRNVAKGLNSVERAELLVRKASCFQDPVYVTLDASRFDKHVSEALLKIEHSVYRHCNQDPVFEKLLNMQLLNRCFSSLGISYVARGRRMSGDMNTAIGNVILMLVMMIAYCRHILNLAVWDCLDDGDDIVVIIERRDVFRFRANLCSSFESFGMEMKMDEACESIHDVEFCQSRVVEYQPSRFKFVRDYRAVFSKATSGVRNWMDPIFRTRVIHAIGTCELVLGLGVPILQSYALALLRNSSGIKDVLKHAPDGLKARALRDAKSLGVSINKCLLPQPILRCSRESFAQAFNCTEAEQLRIEAWLDSWTFDISTSQAFGSEWEVYSWSSATSTGELYRC